ncbi:MAG: O-antigen ligase family protein [Endomicrobiaceae bacterium]|nr:O-antigen ligase family protein [Endomicrobiaceae bacterium]
MFILLIAISCIQILNYHSIIEKGQFFPFSICPIFTLQELMMLVVYFSIFFIITQYFENSEKQNKILLFIIISSFIITLIGLSFPKGEYVQFFLDNKLNFAFGPFVNRNNAGSFLSISFFITLAFVLPNFLSLNRINKNYFKLIAFIIFCLLLLTGTIFTRSRGAMVGTFISLFIFLFLINWYLSKNIKERIVKLSFVCLLFFISFFGLYNNIDTINKFTNRHTGGFSEQARISLYKAGLNILKDFPVTGIGIGAFSISVNKYLNMEIEQYPKRLHSDWLELLVGIGYPAGILFFLLAFFTIFLFLKQIKTLDTAKKIKFIALLCAILSMSISCMVDFHLHIPANAMLFFITLALLSSSTFYKNEVKYYRFPIVIKIIFCLLFAVTIYFSVKDTTAWRATIFAKKLSLESKIKNYEYALSLSNNPRYAYALGLFYYDATKKDNSFTNEQKKEYFQKTQDLTIKNLKKYPFNKDFSYLYQLINEN